MASQTREHLRRACVAKRESNKKTQLLKLVYSKAQIQAKRPEQEDRMFIGDIDPNKTLFVIADGHRGARCVNFVIDFFPSEVQKRCANKTNNLCVQLKSAVKATHDAWALEVLGNARNRFPKNPPEQKKIMAALPKDFFEKEGDSGTTLVCALVDKQKRKVYLVNLGDSRAIILQDELIVSTRDHGVPKVLEYLKNTEFAKTTRVYEDRVANDLAMSASIGDFTPDLLGVLRTVPDVAVFSLCPSACIVLASDGLWESADTQEVLLNPIQNAQSVITRFHQELYDNTSVIVIFVS